MCLDTIHNKKPRASGTGYKLFYKHSEKYTGEFESGPYLSGTWYEASDENWAMFNGYPYGFHIFARKADAKLWQNDEEDLLPVKVAYRKAHTQGTQLWRREVCLLKTIVAYEMKILGEV
jgi:hypothetical protein